MHQSSLESMRKFCDAYVHAGDSVLDVGSLQVGIERGFREMFTEHGCDYRGLDIVEGVNVDILAQEDRMWPLEDESLDVVVSGQCLEHCRHPQAVVCEAFRVLRSGGRCCFIAPSSGEYHHPPDYWRITKDGMQLLLEGAGFNVCRSETMDNEPWRDTIGVGMKP